MPDLGKQRASRFLTAGMVGLCLLGAGASALTAYDIAAFVMSARPANPLAQEPRTGKLAMIGALLSISGLLLGMAAYQTQRKESRQRAVVARWSLSFVLLLAAVLTFLWLVYYPLPRHGHHIDKFLLLTILILLWSAWYVFSPESLQHFVNRRVYNVLRIGVINVIVFIVLAEIMLRLADPFLGRSGLFGGKHTPADLRPHMAVSGFVDRTNSQGFRDKERAIEKAEGAIRVLAIGDSFTWGAGVSYDLAFVTLLERRLQTELPGLEVVNQGVPGWEPPQELHLLKNHGIGFSPDLVLLNFFVGNDIMRRRGAETERALIVAGQSYYVHDNGNWVHDHIGPDRWFLYHNVNYLFRVGSRIFRQSQSEAKVVGMEVSPLGRSRKEYLQELDERTDIYLRQYPPPVESSWIGTQSTLRELKEFLTARHVRLLIVLIPDQIQLDADLRKDLLKEVRASPSLYDFEKPQQLLSGWCADNAVVCLDLLPAFKTHREPARLYLQNDMHWSTAGHALAAQFIFPVLKTQMAHLSTQSPAIATQTPY